MLGATEHQLSAALRQTNRSYWAWMAHPISVTENLGRVLGVVLGRVGWVELGTPQRTCRCIIYLMFNVL